LINYETAHVHLKQQKINIKHCSFYKAQCKGDISSSHAFKKQKSFVL